MSLIITIVVGSVCIGLVKGASLEKPCQFHYDPRTPLNFSLTDTEIKSYSSDKGRIKIPNGKAFRLDCSKALDHLFRRFEVASLDLECKRGNLVTKEGHAVIRQGDIDCIISNGSTKPKSQFIRNGTCYNNATKIDVHFNSNVDKPYVLYTVCHDEKSAITLFSQSFIDGRAISEGYLESGSPRPSFKDTDFFSFDVNQAYKRENQLDHLANLLGSAGMVRRYFPNPQYFFSRGHLLPNADPIYKYQKDATFHYINAVPQWQILNAGNWERLESSVRKLAESLESKLKVWTGTYGVLQLADANNDLVDMWMNNDEKNDAGEPIHRLPVPKFMWKVIYDESEKAAVAVVQINNPWQKVTKNDLLCTDICDDIPWIKFDTTVVKKGYTYCCDVNVLKKTVPFIPSLDYNKLLDYEENPNKSGTDEGDYLNEDEDEGYSSEESDESSDREDRMSKLTTRPKFK